MRVHECKIIVIITRMKLIARLKKELLLLLVLEVDCVVARARVLLEIEVVGGQPEGIEHHVPQLLQVAEHFLL